MVYNKHLQMVFEWLLERWFNNSVVFLVFLKSCLLGYWKSDDKGNSVSVRVGYRGVM